MPKGQDLERPDWPKSRLERLRGGALGLLVSAALAVVVLWLGAYSLAEALGGSSTWQMFAFLSVPVAGPSGRPFCLYSAEDPRSPPTLDAPRGRHSG